MATMTDAALMALPSAGGQPAFVQADVNILRSAFADLTDLNAVFNGLASAHLTGTYAYNQFAKLLTGAL